jgi:hypothetical protein
MARPHPTRTRLEGDIDEADDAVQVFAGRNRKLKQAGYRFGLTTREAVQAFAEALRLAPLRENGGAPYRYEREVEEFLRWSPSVRREGSAD